MNLGSPQQLPGEAFVCGGGTCSADLFRKGSGVSVDGEGRLQGVSLNCAPSVSVAALTAPMPHRSAGVTTVGAIRRLGGSVTPARSGKNDFHCILDGITAEQAAGLFTPAIANPNR